MQECKCMLQKMYGHGKLLTSQRTFAPFSFPLIKKKSSTVTVFFRWRRLKHPAEKGGKG